MIHYKHYKGGQYLLIEDVILPLSKLSGFVQEEFDCFKAIHSESLTELDVYMINGFFYADVNESLTLYMGTNGVRWVRSSDLFFGYVEFNGRKVRRFQALEEINFKSREWF